MEQNHSGESNSSSLV